ncbi:hypothetical protein VP01_1833g2 [Puccinia sorghi]|uniref:Uncharacterized protein n=1 Tax=Puccinia sorghi TaxID=27349 RepID=A0A0L6VDU8_9BASI|nr:hypothetical protein VP01_1833g2 [Puccinia sorghi]
MCRILDTLDRSRYKQTISKCNSHFSPTKEKQFPRSFIQTSNNFLINNCQKKDIFLGLSQYFFQHMCVFYIFPQFFYVVFCFVVYQNVSLCFHFNLKTTNFILKINSIVPAKIKILQISLICSKKSTRKKQSTETENKMEEKGSGLYQSSLLILLRYKFSSSKFIFICLKWILFQSTRCSLIGLASQPVVLNLEPFFGIFISFLLIFTWASNTALPSSIRWCCLAGQVFRVGEVCFISCHLPFFYHLLVILFLIFIFSGFIYMLHIFQKYLPYFLLIISMYIHKYACIQPLTLFISILYMLYQCTLHCSSGGESMKVKQLCCKKRVLLESRWRTFMVTRQPAQHEVIPSQHLVFPTSNNPSLACLTSKNSSHFKRLSSQLYSWIHPLNHFFHLISSEEHQYNLLVIIATLSLEEFISTIYSTYYNTGRVITPRFECHTKLNHTIPSPLVISRYTSTPSQELLKNLEQFPKVTAKNPKTTTKRRDSSHFEHMERQIKVEDEKHAKQQKKLKKEPEKPKQIQPVRQTIPRRTSIISLIIKLPSKEGLPYKSSPTLTNPPRNPQNDQKMRSFWMLTQTETMDFERPPKTPQQIFENLRNIRTEVNPENQVIKLLSLQKRLAQLPVFDIHKLPESFSLMHSHCAYFTVTVPKHLHMQKGGVVEREFPSFLLPQVFLWLLFPFLHIFPLLTQFSSIFYSLPIIFPLWWSLYAKKEMIEKWKFEKEKEVSFLFKNNTILSICVPQKNLNLGGTKNQLSKLLRVLLQCVLSNIWFHCGKLLNVQHTDH